MERINSEQPELSRRRFLKGVVSNILFPGVVGVGLVETGRYIGEFVKEEFTEEKTPSLVSDLNNMISAIEEGKTVLNKKIEFTAENVKFLFSTDGFPHVVLSYDGNTFFEGPYHDAEFYHGVVTALVDFLYDGDYVE